MYILGFVLARLVLWIVPMGFLFPGLLVVTQAGCCAFPPGLTVWLSVVESVFVLIVRRGTFDFLVLLLAILWVLACAYKTFLLLRRPLGTIVQLLYGKRLAMYCGGDLEGGRIACSGSDMIMGRVRVFDRNDGNDVVASRRKVRSPLLK